MWGIRCGQQGYFLPPNVSFTITAGLIVTFTFYKVVAAASERVEDEFIPDTYVSAGYLSKCFERRGGEAKGFIKSFQQQYARFGRKKVQFNHSRNIFETINAYNISEHCWISWLLVPKEVLAGLTDQDHERLSSLKKKG